MALTAVVMFLAYSYKTALVALGEGITGVGIVIMFCRCCGTVEEER